MKHIIFFATLFCLMSWKSSAQSIVVKTYPVLSEESYLRVPGRYEGMGRISIALRDEYREAFINPATLMRASKSYAFILPRWSGWKFQRQSTEGIQPGLDVTSQFNLINRQSTSNFFAPGGFVLRGSDLAVAALAGYEKISSSAFSGTTSGTQVTTSASDFEGSNLPLMLGAAVRIPGTDYSIGGSIRVLDIEGIDGLHFLYPNSRSLHVSGTARDYRIGFASILSEENEFNLLLARSTLGVTQRATYSFGQPVENQNKCDEWQLQVVYRHHLTEELSVGFLTLGNWKEHPKIPNYPLSGVPRDPGTTRAFNFGLGASWQTSSSAIFAAEYVIEPIKTDTWVEALQDRDLGNGRILRKGETEQSNDYRFLNHIVRAAVQFEPREWLTVRFGSELHSYKYDYFNKNFITNREREVVPQNTWTEVTLTGGVRLTLGAFQLSYVGEILNGRGFLEQSSQTWRLIDDARAFTNSLLIVPNDFIVVRPVTVVSHQVSLIVLL